MKLLPALKQKKRYVVFEIIADKKFSFLDVKEEVQRAMKDFLGELGLAKAAPLLLKEKFDQQKQQFLIKINHKYVDEIVSALTLSKSIKNTPIIIKSIITSGTLKKAGVTMNK
jgi:RNase P/RNase MRP subunit POP5